MGVPVDEKKGAVQKLVEGERPVITSDMTIEQQMVVQKKQKLWDMGQSAIGNERNTVIEQANILPLDVNAVSKKIDSISEKTSYEETDQAMAVVLVSDENDSGSIDSSGKGGLVLLPSGGGEDPHKKLYAGS